MTDKIYVYMKKGEDMKPLYLLLQKASHGREPYYDLYTDSNRSYIAFQQLKRRLLVEKGLLIISSINNIGSNKQDVFEELTWLKNNHIETVFGDYPATQIFDNPAANALALNVIWDVYSSLLGNKTFDIRSSLAAPTGRKKISFPDNWESLYAAWDRGEFTAKEFMDKSGLKKGTFYHLINEYKELLEINKDTLDIS